MTDRPSPTDDDLLLKALEQDSDHADLAGLSPSLRAELDGLRAVRSLLDDDAAWGQRSNTDVPPAHLLDAILRAEVVARPDAIRQAIVTAPSTSTTKPLWARLSSWLVGSGVVVGAAAALLITIERVPEAQQAANNTMKAEVAQAPSPPPAPAAMADSVDGFAAGTGGAALEEAAPADVVAEAKNDAIGAAREKAKADSADKGEGSFGFANAKQVAAGKDGRSADADDVASAGAKAARAAPEQDRALSRSSAGPVPMSPPAPMATPAPSAVAPPPPAEPAVTSASEMRRLFKERLAAKEEARKEAAAPAKKGAEALKSAPGVLTSDDMQRDRRAQEANGILVTAENELARGRFQSAVDLAQRAEAAASGTLGLAPASTMARAFLGLQRPADAARVGSRLINGNVADTQIVDGLLAAARAAIDIGDLTLARRLAQVALRPENVDAPRRAQAQALLTTAKSAAANKPMRAREAESKPAADAPASSTTSTP